MNSPSKRDYSPAAVSAWEEMFRAATSIAKDLANSEAWCELSQAEYGVLYTLTKKPEGTRIQDLGSDVLLTQTGLSRLVARLVDRGLVHRRRDPSDARGVLLTLTDAGKETQKRVGRVHAREITEALAPRLTEGELAQLEALCSKLLAPSTSQPRE